MTKLQVCVKQVYLQALFQTLQTTKINFEKLLGKQVFKNNHCSPFQFSSRFVHPCLNSFVFAELVIQTFF